MTTCFSNLWTTVLAVSLLPIAIVLKCAFPGLKRTFNYARNKGFAAVILSLARRLGLPVMICTVTIVLVRGVLAWKSNCFECLTLTEDTVVLDYPWPRSDVQLARSEIIHTEIKQRVFRLTRYSRLEIQTASRSFSTLWLGSTEAIAAISRVRDLVRLPIVPSGKSPPNGEGIR